MYYFKVQEVLSPEEEELRVPEKMFFKTILPNGHLIFTLFRDKAFLFNSYKDPNIKDIYKVIKKDFGYLGYDVCICKSNGEDNV